jgi:hypothetical protein
MAPRKTVGFFTKIQQAREALRDKADKIIEEYLDIAVQAKAAGDYETAYKALQWLIEHMPADEDGKGVVDTSVDKQKQQVAAPTGPAIQIGIKVGGTGDVGSFPVPTVGVKVLDGEVKK